ncbi:lipopolysaccharide biosynthesis protein [Mitsuokella jalaludinii]|uniref:lipopolysaccharide biosynthesis protein n=1 Tax=Mitsuokella jalaludinii TaxID=187979 RepID=UPI0020CFF293|nr:lipopolysaccharide biosynthesis protein [Mitsuokella jalaludinii]MCQ1533903.1 lipopolysaccharide biosynthesis protein [Mitsuokella jalaludinii]
MAFTKRDVFINFIWKLAERSGSQAISFIVTIILARLLMPSDYGTVALVMVFLTILQVFADSGFGVALIQKKNADDLDFSSVFYVNIAVGTLLYVIMWLAAPTIAFFYGMPDLVSLIRVMSLVLLISSLRNVQQAYISKHMLFKRFFYATLGGSIVSAVVGISMAYLGFGVWALVAQQLTNSAIGTAILWFTVNWRPKLLCSLDRLKGLFSFGWKMLSSALLDTGYQQLWQLIIGKLYSPSDLAFFNQGQKFPNLIVTNINASIDSILLPTMASEQDHRERVRDMTRRAIKTSIFIMAPMMMVLAFSSTNVVTLVLTEKWLPCVPFLCIFCINYMFWPVHTANLNAINALGRSDIFLKLEIIKKVVGISVLLFTMQYSVMAMAYGMLLTGVLSQIINSWPNRKLLGYGYLHQLRDLLPSIVLAVIAGGVAYGIGMMQLPIHLALVIALQVIAGAVTYLALSYLFHVDSLLYLFQVIKPLIARKIG